MQSRILGKSGLAVSAMGFGAMALSGVYESVEERAAEATLAHAIALGFTLIDTADFYGKGQRTSASEWGHNETLVGRCLAGRHGDVVLSTKGGYAFSSEGTPTPNGRPEYMRSACEGSLRRLGTDTIDLYYLHRVDPKVPIEETVGAMGDLVRAGKVRHIGLSEASVDDIRRAHATHPIAAVQSEYSLFHRDPELDVLPLCEALGIGFVCFAALARGLLSGAIKRPDDLEAGDWRREAAPRFAGSNLTGNLRLVAGLEQIAARLQRNPAQIALAWILRQRGNIVPLVGATQASFLDDNRKAVDITLSDEDFDEISAIFPIGAAQGARYPEQFAGALRS